ncbi:hypothetical protein QC762_0110130 [Podospora pseudocomata]|uniref:Uncharacterized protein n=1 Tax=Podospora pseudocomata TaxID=2093779 RepID=A0ABR0G3Z2_9PEZI|nr:hypothetical protein QC762_0110130 [Podospora pseudocomata]
MGSSMVGWQSPLTTANIYTPFISTPTTQHPATTYGFDARVRLKMSIPTIAVYCALVMVVPARAKAPLPGT